MDSTRRRRNVKQVEAPPGGDGKKKTPPKGRRYNLRKKAPPTPKEEDEDVVWVDEEEEEASSDSDYKEGESESEDEDTKVHGITVPSNIPVSVKIHLHAFVDEDEDEDEDDDYEDDDEEDEDYEEEETDDDRFLEYLANKYGGGKNSSAMPFMIMTDENPRPSKRAKIEKEVTPALKLNKDERAYFEELPKKKQKTVQKTMENIAKLLTDHDMPFKFRILELPIPDQFKVGVIKKIDTIHKMGPDSGEAHKLKTWVDAFLRIPFGKQIPLPVQMSDGQKKCAEFLTDSRATLDKAVYGMVPAKTQILQVLAQWIANPSSVGNVIALRGPMGVGKTSLARNGIAKALKRPFQFFSLGGASDIAHYVGHSYTYEGSIWGRIIDSIMQAGCMNPVLYFDELDKVSSTPHGEEIISMLIHLTDRSQNMQYHDRYFAGVDFDLSQCLFVFSFNDESKVHPVLKDRMNVIQCSGYNEDEKKIILTDYVWPETIDRFKMNPSDITITDTAIKQLIQDYSAGEEGVRNLIRVVETLIMRINLLRIAAKDDPTVKALKFFMEIEFPFKITTEVTEKLLADTPTGQRPIPNHMYV